ncbi:hypothetical protein M9H77_30049 [Catharanthus roseus]|uniref:Uncharacterized protein n=1 Tax=Catharanthus roseus TaxID=4058 RepID=A0ACB9ZYR3_CATRO|nr:hypothetical protein M9H77_30049 [Catharanthus roseus]
MKILYKRLYIKTKAHALFSEWPDLTTLGILLQRLTTPLFILSQSRKKHDMEKREGESSVSPFGLHGQSPDPKTSQYQSNTLRALDSITTALSISLAKPSYKFLDHIPDLP